MSPTQKQRLSVDTPSLVTRIERMRARIANPEPEDDAFTLRLRAAFLAESEGELQRRCAAGGAA